MHFAISGEIEQPRDHNEGYFSRRKIFCQLGATKLQKSRKKHVQQWEKEWERKDRNEKMGAKGLGGKWER